LRVIGWAPAAPATIAENAAPKANDRRPMLDLTSSRDERRSPEHKSLHAAALILQGL
jgi:hypothetical protein